MMHNFSGSNKYLGRKMSTEMFEDTSSEEMLSPNNRRFTRVLSKTEIDESYDGDETLINSIEDTEADYEEKLRGMTPEQVEELLEKLNLEENDDNLNEEESETAKENANETAIHVVDKIIKSNKNKEIPVQSKKVTKVNKKGATADSQNKSDDITAPPASPTKEEVKPKRGKNKKEDAKNKVIYESKPPSDPEDEIKTKRGKRGKNNDVNNVEVTSDDKKLEEIENETKTSKTKKGAKGKPISSENIKEEIHEQENTSKQKSKLNETTTTNTIINTTDASSSQPSDYTQNNKSKTVLRAGKKLNPEVSDNKELKSKLGKSKNNPNIAKKELADIAVQQSTQSIDVVDGSTKVKQGKQKAETKKTNSFNIEESKTDKSAKAKKATTKDGAVKVIEKLEKTNPKKNNQKVLKEVNNPLEKAIESEVLPDKTTAGRPKRNIKKDNSEQLIENSSEVEKPQKPNTKLVVEEEKPELIKSKPKTKVAPSKEKLPNKENKVVEKGETTKRATRNK